MFTLVQNDKKKIHVIGTQAVLRPCPVASFMKGHQVAFLTFVNRPKTLYYGL